MVFPHQMAVLDDRSVLAKVRRKDRSATPRDGQLNASQLRQLAYLPWYRPALRNFSMSEAPSRGDRRRHSGGLRGAVTKSN